MFRNAMNTLARMRFWIALSLGIAAAAVAYYWPASPRAVLHCEHTCWHLAFSHDGSRLAALDREAGLDQPGQVLVWDVPTGQLLHRFDYGMRPFPSKVIFAPDDKSLGLVDAGTVTKWDLNTGQLIGHYDHAEWSHDPDHYRGREILFSPAGRWLAHDVYEGRVYDVETGAIVQDYHERWPDRHLGAHGGCVAALVQDELKMFDAITGVEVATFPIAVKRGTMSRTGFWLSADGTQGVFWENNQWVIHNAVTGRHFALPLDIECCLSSDNRLLAVSFLDSPRSVLDALRLRLRDKRVHVLDTTTGAEVCPPIRWRNTCCFAPDGKMLAVADLDRQITLWDLPPPSCWPLVLAVVAPTMLLTYGVCFWWGRRRVLK